MVHSSVNPELQAELDEKGYLSILKLVEYLQSYPLRKASYPTIKRMVERGEIRGEKIGKQYRIAKEDIEYYIDHGMRVQSKPNKAEGAPAPSDTPKANATASEGGLPSWLGKEPPNVDHLKKNIKEPTVLDLDDRDDYDI